MSSRTCFLCPAAPRPHPSCQHRKHVHMAVFSRRTQKIRPRGRFFHAEYVKRALMGTFFMFGVLHLVPHAEIEHSCSISRVLCQPPRAPPSTSPSATPETKRVVPSFSFFHYGEVGKVLPVLSLLCDQRGGGMSLLVSFCINDIIINYCS